MADTDVMTHPAINPETAEYWKAAAEGKLLVKHCESCGENHFYPRAHCPHCRSLDTTWQLASGRGTIYSYSVMRRVSPPFVTAYVTLEDGPTMFTNIVDCDVDALKIGQQVAVTFVGGDDGLTLPVFTPV